MKTLSRLGICSHDIPDLLHTLFSKQIVISVAQHAGIALGGSIINFVVEPLGTKVLFERYALENASGPKDKEKIKSLKGKFGAFHGISSLLNLIVLIAVAAHGYYLASQISFT